MIDKKLALDIMYLLSGLEAAGIISRELPSYLAEELSIVVNKMREIVLEKEE